MGKHPILRLKIALKKVQVVLEDQKGAGSKNYFAWVTVTFTLRNWNSVVQLFENIYNFEIMVFQ